MSSLVVDTHVIVWYLSGDARLSATAGSLLDAAGREGHPVYVPSICLVELVYLTERGRIPPAALSRLLAVIEEPENPWRLAPLDLDVVHHISGVSRSEVPDLPDRIVCATALAKGLPLISRDHRIRASGVRSLW